MNKSYSLLLGLVALAISLISPTYIFNFINTLIETDKIIILSTTLQGSKAELIITTLILFLIVALLITLKELGSIYGQSMLTYKT